MDLSAEPVDANSAIAFAILYLSKLHMTAVDMLNDRLLSFKDAQGVALDSILSVTGCKYCDPLLHHPLENNWLVERIQLRTTKVGLPKTNGMVGCLQRTL